MIIIIITTTTNNNNKKANCETGIGLQALVHQHASELKAGPFELSSGNKLDGELVPMVSKTKM